MLGLVVAAVPLVYLVVKGGYPALVGVSRIAIIVLIAVAAAAPQMAVEQQRSQDAEVVVLKDGSRSAGLMNYDSLELEGVKIEEKTIASGNSSDLRNGLLRNLEPDTSYLVVSDFQSENDLSGVAEEYARVNSTLNALKVDMTEEHSVAVKGPSTTVPGAENRFSVETYSTGNSTEVEVFLDGEKIYTRDGSFSFDRTFDSEGVHRIRAVINADDRYPANNEYFKTVRVVEKPEILVVGGEGSLAPEVEQFFEVSHSDDVPENLDDYYAVVLKNSVDDSALIEYVSEGNGVVYTGDYSSPMEILPVKATSSSPPPEDTRIVLVIDISKSTEEDIQEAQQIAYSLADSLPGNSRVGAVAYSEEAFVVSQPEILAYNRENLKDKISRLETGVLSYHDRGLKGGRQLSGGEGNVILMTDGKFSSGQDVRLPDQIISESYETASEMDARLIVVGVGEDPNTGYLRDLSDRNGGFYRSSSATNTLPFFFKSGGGGGSVSSLVNMNPDHFITRGGVSGAVTLFDSVAPRRGADTLVGTDAGNPVLTVWRYGLGRVAAFSADNEDLQGIMSTEPSLGVRSLSWAAGNLQRKRDRWVEAESGRQGERIEITASYPLKGLKRKSSDTYTRELQPNATGFHSYQGIPYAYNYNPEIERVGYSDSMEDVVEKTGGRVYSPDERAAIAENLESFSSRKVPVKQSLAPYLIIVAMLVFLAEIGYRKLKGKR